MLGALLGVGQQLGLGGLVLLGCGAARAGARQRTDGDFLPFRCVLLPYQNLGAGTDDMEVAEVVEVHVGAGVERTQRAVQRQRALGVTLLDALAHLHLHEITRGDQLLGLLHRPEVVLLGEVALGRIGLAGLDHWRTDRVLEQLLEVAQALLGIRIGLGLRRVGINDQVQLAREVVDDCQLFALQQQDVRRAQRVERAGGFELFLDVAHSVIAKIASQAATKTGEPRAQRHFEALLVLLNEVQRVTRCSLDHLAITQNFGFGLRAKATGSHQRTRWQANEAVAAKALATHH